MRTFATLENLSTAKEKNIIVRNLNRIMDIVVLELDIENSSITFLHATKMGLENAKRELNCLGFPIRQLQIQKWSKSDAMTVPNLA